MLYLGIDQHRKQLTVNLRNEEGAAPSTSALASTPMTG